MRASREGTEAGGGGVAGRIMRLGTASPYTSRIQPIQGVVLDKQTQT